MNSGAEAVETAIKLARRWGYQKGHSRRTGRNHRLRQQLSRAHHHDRQFFVGSAVSRWLRSVYARFCDGAVWRSGGATSGDYATDLRISRRADPSGSRYFDSTRRILGCCGGAMQTAQRAAHRRRDSDGAWPHRTAARLSARKRPSRCRDFGQSAVGRRLSGVGGAELCGCDGCLSSRQPRQHLWRQSVGMCGGAGGDPGARR